MAGETPAVEVQVTVNKSQAEKDFKAFTDALIGSLTPTIDLVNVAEKAWDTLKDGVRAVVDFMAESVEAANAQVAAETRLESALRARGFATEGVVARLGAYNTALSQLTGYEDDALLGIQSQLTALGIAPDMLEGATKATIGLAEVTGKDLHGAATAMARILEGNFTILERSGIHATSVADAFKKLSDSAELATGRMATLGPQVALLTTNFGELKETLGDPIARSRGLIGSVSILNEVLLGFTTVVGKVRDVAVESDVFGKIAGTLATLASVPIAPLVATLGLMGIELREVGKEAKALTEQAALLDSGRTFEQRDADNADASAHLREMVRKAAEKRAKAAAETRKRQILELNQLHAGEEGALEGAEAVNPLFRAFGPGLRAMQQGTELLDVMQPSQRFQEKIARDQGRAQNEAEIRLSEQKRALREKLGRLEDGDDEVRRLRRLSAEQDFYDNFGQASVAGLTNVFGSLIVAGAAGKKDLDIMAAQAFGGLLAALGSTLFNAGAGALAAATLGGFFPFLRAAGMGGPEGIPAALAAMAIGGGLMALGGGVQGAVAPPSVGGSGGASSASAPRGGGASFRESSGTGDFGQRSSAPVTNVFSVTISGGLFGGSRRAIARDLATLLAEHKR